MNLFSYFILGQDRVSAGEYAVADIVGNYEIIKIIGRGIL
jgi:hypothetical protein